MKQKEEVEFLCVDDLLKDGFKQATNILYLKKTLFGLEGYGVCGDCLRIIGPFKCNKEDSKGAVICSYCNSTTEFTIPKRRNQGKLGVSY